MTPLPKVALIAGPTASGKSALALALAEARNGVVINADASQVYAELRVLTARPSQADEARAPHRLYGYLSGDQPSSAARWAEDAKATIGDIHAAERLPILVGGTGLYLRTLLDGIAPVPPIDPTIRAEVRALPVIEAHARLERHDPAAAARLYTGDTTRVARALEVVLSTQRTLADWQAERRGGIGADIALAPVVLLPPRDVVMERCDARVEEMVAGGAVDEVSALLASGYAPDAPVMRAIGVREIAAMLAGTLNRDDAVRAIKLATRQYAKRQYTWFRNQPPREWLRLTRLENGDTVEELATLLR